MCGIVLVRAFTHPCVCVHIRLCFCLFVKVLACAGVGMRSLMYVCVCVRAYVRACSRRICLLSCECVCASLRLYVHTRVRASVLT